MKWALLILLIGLIGCSSHDKKPVEVQVPVSIPCLSKRPVLPELKFSLLQPAKNEAEALDHVKMLWLDRQNLIIHSVDWDTAAAGCQAIKQ